MYVDMVNEKYVHLYEYLLTNMKDYLSGINKLSKNRLPVEFFPPSRLKEFSDAVLLQVQKTHPHYELAIPHLSYYYDMKLSTFGVDRNHSLIITFPTFVQPKVMSC
jgi:hypothetical protein